MDVDTAYLLQELEREIDVLREQKRRDQFVIQDIQRKIGGMSSGGPASNSRLRILGDPNYIDTLPYNDYGQVVQGYSNLPKSPRSKQY